MKKVKIIALISAVATALLLFLFLKNLNNQAKTEDTVGVVVATADITANTQVTSNMVEIKYLPAEAVYSDAFTSLSDVVGKVSETDVIAGEQLNSKQFADAGGVGAGTLAYSIEPGMRAITISVDEISGLCGMLKPGNKVDIIALFDSGTGSVSAPTSKMLLQNITVLAVDSILSKSGKSAASDGSAASYTSITLEVTAEQAMETSLSAYSGNLKVILRSPLDSSSSSISNITLNGMIN